MITAFIIGSVFIAVYVGLQRAPEPSALPIAATEGQLANSAQDGFGSKADVIRVATAAEGIRLVRDGRAVASLSRTSPHGLRLDYAGAKGLSEAGAAQKLAAGLAARAGLVVQARDVVPLAEYDSRGLAPFYVSFGVTLSSFILAQGLSANASRIRLRNRLLATGGFAILIGATAAVISGPILGALTAPVGPLVGTLALLSAATAFATKAFVAWLGPLGNALSVLMFTTLGNATSGASVGYDLLPAWARAISPALPSGAAVRSLSEFGYFSGANTDSSLVVLAGWSIAGLGLVLLRFNTRRVAAPSSVPVPAAAPEAARARARPPRPPRGVRGERSKRALDDHPRARARTHEGRPPTVIDPC